MICRILIALLFAIGIGACGSAPPANERAPLPYDSLLVGQWQQVGMEVVITSMDGLDSSYSISVPPEKWEEQMNIRPIFTEYFPDHRYRTEFRDLRDSLTRVSRGIWNIFGDTLLLIEPDATYQYRMERHPAGLKLFTFLDWDGDGVEDDEYTGIQKKLPK